MTEYAADLIILEPDKIDVPGRRARRGTVLGCGHPVAVLGRYPGFPRAPAQRLWRATHPGMSAARPAPSVPRAGGGLVVAAGNAFLSLDPLTGAVAELASAPGLPDTRMNDGKCDRAGRFYAGTMAADESPGKGSFYRLDTDLNVTEIYTGIGISNGLGWSPDDRCMYYIDSLAYRVDVLDYDAADRADGRATAVRRARLG